MGLKFFSRVAIALAIVLIAVVILEFMLLTLYVKEQEGDVIKATQEPIVAGIRGLEVATENNNFASSAKESNSKKEEVIDVPTKRTLTLPTIHVSAVVCGDRAIEATTMLKSTTLFTKRTVQLHVVAEDQLHDDLKNIFNQWHTVRSGKVMFKIYSLHFPGEKFDEWKRLFKPCASQRLFLVDVLDSIDSVLYMDTDTLLLRPVDDIWDHFKNFDSWQLASMTPEGEETSLTWYPRFARHPFAGKNGMNSGVMLLNLTRMRAFGWKEKIIEAYNKYKLSITWGDQDLINIVFHDHPGLLYVYTCDWNYRPDHCMYGNNCGAAKGNGISVVHGNRGVFHNDKQVFFKAIYNTLRDFKPGENITLLATRLSENLKSVGTDPYCNAMVDSVLKYPKKYSVL